MRFAFLLLAAASATAQVMAQTTTPPSTKIDFPSVAEALKTLEARDGDGTVVTHPDGWTVINEPLASAQWSFTPNGYYAHPAVVRRIIKRAPGGAVSVETTSLCEAAQAECDKLMAEFATMNERITQAARARSRPAPAQPAQ